MVNQRAHEFFRAGEMDSGRYSPWQDRGVSAKSRYGLWAAGGFLMDQVTCPEETRSAPFRYASVFGMLIVLGSANRFLAPVLTVGLLSAGSLCSCLSTNGHV
jgi:hypothetical protein